MQLFRLRINLDIIKEKIIMAKQGFAASDRRKVEVLTAVDKAVEVHDCGTIFVLASAGASAISIPAAATLGEGWWCKFVVGVEMTGNDVITFGTGTVRLLNISVDGTANFAALDGQALTLAHAADNEADEVLVEVANGEFFVRALSAL